MHVYCDVWQGVRHEFLAILQAMVVAFPDQREFQGLSGLHDTDIDSDFFENIRHIQVSRSLLVTVCVRCVFVHVHECLCVFVFSDFVCSVCVCIYVCVCVCVYVCVCVHNGLHKRMYCTYGSVFICIHPSVSLSSLASMIILLCMTYFFQNITLKSLLMKASTFTVCMTLLRSTSRPKP